MGRKSLDSTNLRCSCCARVIDAFARGLWLLEEVVVFFFVDFDAVDDFFLLDEVELACEVDISVVVARAGSPRAWTSKQKVKKRAKRRPRELTALQCSAIFRAAIMGLR